MIRFNAALDAAITFVKENRAALGDDCVILRDLRGIVRLVVRQQPTPELGDAFARRLGAFAPPAPDVFLCADDLMDAEAVFSSPDIFEPMDFPGVRVLERTVTGQDWLRPTLAGDGGRHPRRATLYGIKGGVGRSTALSVLAWHLAARRGLKVLVIDLDLESPGLGAMTLPRRGYPDFGVVDWLVEQAVGQADSTLVRDMAASSPTLSGDRGGVVRVVTAEGRNETDYLAKLSRAYVSLHGAGGDFASRLEQMIHSLEAAESPDVTLLDSRAGLHDIAAIALTRLGATAFLFGTAASQTWDGYRALFRHLLKHPNVRNIRERLRMVASLTPESGGDAYVRSVLEQSYSLWGDTLYDAAGATDLDAFNFDIDDDSAPHWPLRINWSRRWQDGLVASPAGLSADSATEFHEFLERAADLILAEDQGEP